MYKTLTGIMAKRISTHLEEQSLLPAEQKGCHPGSKGCKEQLMISKTIYEDCRRRNKNLSIAWIDYQKAFDSIPHSWVEKSIELVGVNSKIVRFLDVSRSFFNFSMLLLFVIFLYIIQSSAKSLIFESMILQIPFTYIRKQ